jgi:hypothetical protein
MSCCSNAWRSSLGKLNRFEIESEVIAAFNLMQLFTESSDPIVLQRSITF